MATNEIFERGTKLQLAATDPATPVSGDPALAGQLPLVCEVSEGADGLASYTTEGVHRLSVKGIDQGGNSAVAVGDIIYYVTGDTPKLSKKNTGVRYGYAMETVGSAATATIRVKLGY